ncbi:MAG: hypothetical protein E6H00_06790 [Bacillati bacterium ANGP1]|uniref:Sulfocyanin-like C-terminal domain-containing protein n=1 Tax=Candidatus Segetimicrobium genomatis TaxID=2569760 RepID=A0A537K3X8_9BACT|nr:MAG: hypothetical protein E6H00_06790 [Terrabacteria group bacterium ANGP1]
MSFYRVVWRIVWPAAGAALLAGGVLGPGGHSAVVSAAAPPWMRVDAAHKLASFTVTAAQGGANGTLNFNGYANGRLTVTVPTGWRVHIDFVNSGAGALPHSFEVIRDTGKIPPQGIEPPAIPRAETGNLIAGVPPMRKDTVDFIAAPPGRYLWFCGVPSHGISGMWNRFVVGAGAGMPAVTIK